MLMPQQGGKTLFNTNLHSLWCKHTEANLGKEKDTCLR
jgi:hypothetical protein